MLSIEQLIAFTIIFTIDSVTPGAVVARSATTSAVRTLPFIAGLVFGDLVLFAFAVAGLAALAAAFGPLFFIIKWAGIGYLLYLAFRLWTAKPSEFDCRNVAGNPSRLFGLGSMLPLGNPKAIGFYIALLPAVLDPTPTSRYQCASL